MLLYIVLGVVFIILYIIILMIIVNYSKLNRIKIKVDEAEDDIEKILIEKYTIISKIDKSIKKKNDSEFFKGLYDTNIEELDNFELNKKLSKYDNSIMELTDYNKELEFTEEELHDFDRLNTININRLATEKYYNDNVLKLNSLITKFPVNIISKFKGYSKKDLFTNEKEEIFEILKN